MTQQTNNQLGHQGNIPLKALMKASDLELFVAAKQRTPQI